jgi:uncharacterized protein YdaL
MAKTMTMTRWIFALAFFTLHSSFLTVFTVLPALAQQPKKVLIVVEGKTDLNTFAMSDGRQLATLLGHFNVNHVITGADEYVRGSMAGYQQVFYVGFNAKNVVPRAFLDDVLAGTVPVMWLHTGFAEFSASYDLKKRFGFSVSHLDSTGVFTVIEHGADRFTKDEPIINLVTIGDRARVKVIATAYAPKTGRRIPYIVGSGNFLYCADSPFSLVGTSDRYILFADMLHDILGEQHAPSHSALIRIEDVNPTENPDRLRDLADILSGRGIPFLVGVSPFYVSPSEGIRISLSEKPDLVDALKYMVHNGGTIVMHGVTHQYHGQTGTDYEFWDESTNRPIAGETEDGIRRKIEMGIQEFVKNGLYPLIWETPHYTASSAMYRVIGEYFTTAMEQRLAIENADCSQYFPYVIHRDLFGQMIYPENLGYVPLLADPAAGKAHVLSMIRSARVNLAVRDGFVSSFFHSFVDHTLLEELVDSVRAMGYTYVDVRDDRHRVQMHDRVILTGSQVYSVFLTGQYLAEMTFDQNGDVKSRITSDQRLTGKTTRSITLEPGEWYKAEPTEFRERQLSAMDQAWLSVRRTTARFLSSEESWQEARPVILWNQYARGAAYNDQASFAALFASLSIPVDTVFVGEPLSLEPHNIVIVPYGFVDSLRLDQYDQLVRWVKTGGNLITDMRNYLIEELGVRFTNTSIRVNRVQDRVFPEERITWRSPESLIKFEAEDADEVFCIDNETESPLVAGREIGKGKVIFIGTRFDPHSQLAYSHYPFMFEYIRTYFGVAPVLRREGLEMYFDPGFRHTQSIERLISLWVRQGIRRIHVAGWHTYPKYTYDYERLLRLAHANGILVYAWLEPPQVSQKFWLEHPEWREKNFRGEDVRPSWRYPVAMTDSRARAAMVAEYDAFLHRYDWDGVNLAELYFEAGRGFADSTLYTPMHPSARRDLIALLGTDPAGLFKPRSQIYWRTHPGARNLVTEYRVRMLERIFREVFSVFDRLRKERPGFEVIVTAMDAIGSPELREYIGVDMSGILRLQKGYGFALQIEDPEHRWSTDPMRYVSMGEDYARYLGSPDKLLLDLNILSFRKPEVVTPFPTSIQTGTECFQLIRAAALGAPRATIYAESSVNPQDMMLLSAAWAATVSMQRRGNDYLLSAPHQFMLKLPPAIREVYLDGTPFAPVRDNLFLIPAGQHAVSPVTDMTGTMSPHQFYPHILSFTGTLLSMESAMRTLTFQYTSDGRCLVTINREPHDVMVDGQPLAFTPMKGNDGYTFFLPQGAHRVEVVAGDAFSYGVNLTSFWSSTAIAMFGGASVVLLLGMYAWVVVRRRTMVAPVRSPIA